MAKNNKLNAAVDAVMKRDSQNREALSLLLTQQREKDGHLLALGLHMGETPSYLATVPLSWVAQHVRFAGDLPIFKTKVKETTKAVTVDAGTIDDIQQRQPDWRRQLPMTTYLATRLNRKFPPLLVVGYQGWVFNPKSDAWGDDKRALKDSVNAVSLEPKGVYYDLDVKDTNYYALDGQHRLMAILGLKELLDKGRLFSLSHERKPGKESVTLEQVIEYICATSPEKEDAVHERLQRVMNEDHIGVEIIPAVVNNERYADARLRLRGVFVAVNENAKKPTKGEAILLDDNDGFRIVARRVMVSNTLLRNDNVQKKQGQLHEDSPCYTTLESLVEIAKAYLPAKPEFSRWGHPMFGNKALGVIRPEESEIESATNALNAYFDALSEALPSHIGFLRGTSAADIRGEPKGKDKDKEDNILFRPIAQVALATAVATLEREYEKTLADVIPRLAAQEEKGQLKLHSKDAPWFGVLCDPIDGKMRRHKSYQDLCADMFVYLLGGGIPKEKRDELTEDFAKSRKTTDDAAYNFDGKVVPFKVDDNDAVLESKVQLPHLW